MGNRICPSCGNLMLLDNDDCCTANIADTQKRIRLFNPLEIPDTSLIP